MKVFMHFDMQDIETFHGTGKEMVMMMMNNPWRDNKSILQYRSRVVSVLDSGAEGPRFESQLRRCRVTVLGKLFTPIVPLFTKQQNW